MTISQQHFYINMSLVSQCIVLYNVIVIVHIVYIMSKLITKRIIFATCRNNTISSLVEYSFRSLNN